MSLRRLAGWRRPALAAAVLAGGVVMALLALDRLFPLPRFGSDGAQVVVAADGTPLRTYPSRDGVWRYPVGPGQVSPHYLQTLLTYEDRWFYWHPGVNPFAMARAGWQWAAHGRIVSGGSTLTMQVARLLDPELAGQPSKTLSAKLRQAWRAIQLEMHYSKDEILALYLSHAPMGGIVEGVEMGARMWLGKSAADLSHAEAALLTALPQAPSRLRPDRHPQAAQLARDKVLQRMAQRGVWDAALVADARIENVVAPPLRARWLAPLAAQRLLGEAGPAAGVVRSTLDPDIQSTVEAMLLDRVDALPPKVSMAVLVMDNDSLEVKAYAGSADFADDSRYAHVDMVRGVRSPGSTLKPFLYALALDEGLIHSESLLLDAPLSFGGYAPGNFQAAFAGPVSVAQALQRSLNVPAVDLLDRVGPARFASVMLAGGVHLRMPAGAAPNLSLILGGGGTTLEELVGAYRALARGGLSGRPRLRASQPRIEARLMSPGAAWIVRDILESGGHPDRPLFQGGAAGRQLAWKTGTSFGFRDAWAVGVTDRYTIGAWVGRPDGTPNPGFFGANVAAPLLRDIVAALPAGAPAPRTRPPQVQAVVTCWPLGWRLGSAPAGICPERRVAWALDDTVPPSFVGYADTATGPLRIEGVADGSILRPVPGRRAVTLEVGAQGASGEVWWMLDGKVYRSGAAGQAQTLTLSRNGRYALTVMDGQGRYAGLVFEISGVTP
ncbi:MULTISPECIES: penicillin-binding protein 1C [Bordetella]|uniref:peptidoglycan glycosyltransferase n=2 Tax=Bordetella bronchiseptica TaxID=518 RepID=A0A0C6P146_BORBO|nr:MULTISPECIES: penicillin-binding protein 1C [Bordetella]SHT33720.1 glycosyl transferase family protein [Mycobacteroides abscessus subsp. abscessus]AOB27508.1 penicillin-binding protein 1C [Bordetella bronchiseptica]ARP77231.1 penicillin-binding protein 1C [Bordetella genomosp. 6]AWP75888.1 penicillin-binding protein 1C [Bordetella bronchiseptica]AZW22665.1 penicillin-binding protein 1C [Bordetella bronchiseptica]